ncbi:Ankyrin repeat-containing protein [Quillaja saponaria]|uniref:Ankyrin repeat-containing protein n=1 Tax=Quillaja saponaria TaxID=32244 RepID=A0AAD7M3X1_QUISA|nr:Ankyrin repeat-containing protein [Quillaja saponaria]
MSTGNVDLSTIPQLQDVHQIKKVTSAQLKTPSLHLLAKTREQREQYLKLGVPLYKAALRGDWEKAKSILNEDQTLLNASITQQRETVLHVATAANQVHFVEELVELIDADDLALQDYQGNTAFCFAAVVGNVEITEIMRHKNPCLPTIRGGAGLTPLYFSILHGQSKMARYLLPQTIEVLEEGDWNMLFFTCIKTDLYDLALEMFKNNNNLALARDENNETGLHVMARKRLAFETSGMKLTRQSNWIQVDQAVQLINYLWHHVLCRDESDIITVISKPSHLLFTAAEVGNVEFLVELMSSYPDLLWEKDKKNRGIIHIAVLHRHAGIFNLIRELASMKDIVITSVVDDDKNNLLHLAAQIAPLDQLNVVSGAALQMHLELLWFEEVKKIMLPSFIEMKNSKGITPRQLFSIEHKELLSKAESWMKDTANLCVTVSTLITTVVFCAGFSIPGGNPHLQKLATLVFKIFNATAIISSSTSVLMFSSILRSRYKEDDFFMSLPIKLMIGLVSLFISITSLAVAFSIAFIAYSQGWPANFFVLLNLFIILIVATPLSLGRHRPYWIGIIYSTYHCRFLFRPSKYMLNKIVEGDHSSKKIE